MPPRDIRLCAVDPVDKEPVGERWAHRARSSPGRASRGAKRVRPARGVPGSKGIQWWRALWAPFPMATPLALQCSRAFVKVFHVICHLTFCTVRYYSTAPPFITRFIQNNHLHLLSFYSPVTGSSSHCALTCTQLLPPNSLYRTCSLECHKQFPFC